MYILFATTDVPYVLQVFSQRQEAEQQLKPLLRSWARKLGLLGADEQLRKSREDSEEAGVWLQATEFGWVIKRTQQQAGGWIFDSTSLSSTRLAEVRLLSAEDSLCAAELKALRQELDRLYQLSNELEVKCELQRLSVTSRNNRVTQLEQELTEAQRAQQEQSLVWMLERSSLEQRLQRAGEDMSCLVEQMNTADSESAHKLAQLQAKLDSANSQRDGLEATLQLIEAKLDQEAGALHLAEQRYQQALASARFLEGELKKSELAAARTVEALEELQLQRKLDEQVATFESLMTQDQIAGLDKRLRAAQRELERCQGIVHEQDSVKQNLDQQLRGAQLEAALALEQIGEFEKQLHSQASILEEKQAAIEAGHEAQLELCFDLDRNRAKLAEAHQLTAKLNLQQAAAEQKVIALQEQLSQQQLRNDQVVLERQLERLQSRHEKVIDQAQLSEHLLELSQRALEKTTSELCQCKARLGECEEQLSCNRDWIETLEAINAQRSEALGERAELQDRVAELHTALEQSRDLTAISNSENALLRAALEQATAEAQAMRKEIASRESWVSCLAADEAVELRSRIAELETARQNLVARLEFDEQWNQELSRSVDELENDCKFYRSEMQAALEETQHYCELAEQRQQELNSRTVELDRLATAQQETAATLEQKQSRIRELESMVRRLERELASIAEMEKDLLQQNMRKDWEISDLRNAFSRDAFFQ